jgi:ribonuclease HII
MIERRMPDFSFEDQHNCLVAGVDEAGRGPWAGPVVAAAVILDRNNFPQGLDDSKKLSAKKREALFDPIMETAIVGIGQASVEEIDDINILQATLLAMQRAVDNLDPQPGHILIDGNRLPKMEISAETIIKGDGRSFSIAAASIIAKTFRDQIMTELAQSWPDYGWERNAGYGTALHQQGLNLVGISPHHRKSFAPIRKIQNQDYPITQ